MESFAIFAWNASLLAAFCILYPVFTNRLTRETSGRKLSFGLIFGLLAILTMAKPWRVLAGVTVDGSSIPVILAGLVYGPLPAAVAAAVAILYLFAEGSGHVLAGCGLAISSALLGLIFHRTVAKRPRGLSPLNLYLIGFALSLAVLAWMLSFPGTEGIAALQAAAGPVILVFPLATALLGRVMVDVPGSPGLPTGAKGVVPAREDVTELRAHQGEIARLNRLYAALSRVNKTLLRGCSEEELFQTVCLALAESGGFRLVAIGRHEPETRRVCFVARAGQDLGYLDQVTVFTDDRPEGWNPLGTSIREDRDVVANDFFGDPRMSAFHPAARDYGFRAAAAFPIRLRGAVWGALGVYEAETDVLGDGELRLLDEVAGDVSFAMEGLEKDRERLRIETALAKSEERYRYLFERVPLPMWVCHRKTLSFLDVNAAAADHYGYSREEFLNMKVIDIHDIERDPGIPETLKSLPEGLPHRGVFPQRKKDGTPIEVEVVRTDVDFGHEPARLALAVDVTERQRAEARNLQLNRVYTVLSNVNQAVIRVRDSQALFEEACRIAVEDGGFFAAWIGLVDDATGEIRAAAKRGSIGDYLDGIRVTTRPEVEGQGPMGTAIRENRPVVCNDIEHDDAFAPWREAAIRRGFRSVAAFPLTIGDRAVGAFVHYSDTAGFFDPDEVRLLGELASDVSFAAGFLEEEGRRRQAELALAESDELFSSAFQHAAIGMAVLDTDGHFLRVNNALCRLLGYSEEEFLTLTFQEITHRDDLAANRELLRQMLAGKFSAFRTEKRYVARSGEVIWVLLNASLVRDSRGKPLRYISQVQDFTDRRRAEEALRASEREQREIARQLEIERTRLLRAQAVANVGSWETELPGLQTAWSAQMHRIFGTDPRHAPSHARFLDLVHPQDRARVDEAFVRSLDERAPCSIEHRVLTPDGSIKVLEERWQVFADEQGKPVRALGTSLDITDRVRAEDEIHAANQRLAYHVENSPLAVVEWDSEFRVQRWSSQAEQLFGWRAEEVLGLSPADWRFVHEDDWTAVSAATGALLRGKVLRELSTNRNYTRDGRVVHCEWYNSVMIGRDGTIVSILSLVHDITDRKLSEAALIQSGQQLRALSARLETLREEERTRISREIHDELGQMLTGIKMDLRWVENRLDVFGDDRRINPILDKLVTASELTDETVKTVQRIAAALRPGILDKLGLATALEYESSQFEDRTGIRCEVTIGDGFPRLPSEAATAFFRIFQEALTNVARHAHATSVETELRSEGGVSILEVRDNGIGIALDAVENPTSLGLMGMEERARLLGGTVSLARRPDGGTEMTVRIPNGASRAAGA